MARPTFVGATRSENTAASTLTATLPSHSTGDLLVILAQGNRRLTGISINEGYTALFAVVQEDNTRPISFRAFAKIAGASETNPVLTFDSSESNLCDAIALAGTTTTIGDIVSVTTIADGSEQSDAVFPSASVAETDSIAIRHCSASDDNQVVTPPAAPSGHTIIIEAENSNGQIYFATMRVDADPATLGSATWSSIWASFASTEVGAESTIIIPPVGSADPTITDVDADEDIDDKQTGIVVTGTNFEASQGTGKLEISDNATYGSGTVVLQDETAWADTSITITADIGAMAPGLIRYVWVTNNTGDRNGTGFQVRFRRAQAIRMIASSNIAASGENTTQRLATPSGKVSGDFDGGRIQDDENPTDTIDPTLDGFIEHEWCIEATTDANDVQYQFRVLIGGVVPATLSVDPRWTVVSTGILAAVEALAFAGTPTLDGLGTLAGSESLDLAETALLSGLGALNSSESLVFNQVATGSLQGILAGGAGLILDNLVTPGARGDLLTSSPLAFAEDVSLSGLGSLASTEQLLFDSVSSLHGLHPIAAAQVLAFAETATANLKGILAGTENMDLSQVGTLLGKGALTGSENLSFADLVALVATGALVSTESIVFSKTATLIATGVLAGSEPITLGQLATLVATGALTSSEAIVLGQSAVLTGTGALAGSKAIILGQAAILTGTSALTAQQALLLAQTSTLSGLGALISSESLLFDDSVTLINGASGALAATETLIFGRLGLLTGIGSLAGSKALTLGQFSSLIGTGALVGSEALTLGQSGLLIATGSLAGSKAIVLGQSGLLTGIGSLAGSELFQFDDAATLINAASGAIATSEALLLGQSGLLIGRGALAGSEAMILAQSGVLTGQGILAGISPTIFAETGILTGTGALNTVELVVFSESGSLTSVSNITAAEALAFFESGLLTGSGILIGTAPLIFSASLFLDVDIGGIFNAVEYFPTGQSVTISLYDPISGAAISLADNDCVEIPGTGVYIWEVSDLTTQPNTYQEFGYRMTDGSTFKSGIV